MKILIETSQLLFRDVRNADFDAFYAYMRDETYWRHLPMEPPTEAWLRRFLGDGVREQRDPDRQHYFLAATEKGSGQVVGEALLKVTEPRHRQAEVGWAVAASWQRRGFGTEIAAALVAFGFAVIGLHRIYARCRLENLGSQAVMRRIGMQHEAVFRGDRLGRDGSWWWTSQWSILESDPRPVAAEILSPGVAACVAVAGAA